MFYGVAAFNQPVSHLDVSQVSTMGAMFYKATMFNQSMQSWNTSKVTNMSFMFNDATAFNQPVLHLDVSQVTTIGNMFAGAILFSQSLQSWTTSRVNNMAGIFNGAASLTNQSTFGYMKSYRYEHHVLYAVAFNQPVSHLDVFKVTTMERMFEGAIMFDQELQSWNTASVMYMGLI